MGLGDAFAGPFGVGYDAAVEYRCLDCGREFVYSAALEEPDCPYCDSENLLRVGG